jgi:hypothetical protein
MQTVFCRLLFAERTSSRDLPAFTYWSKNRLSNNYCRDAGAVIGAQLVVTPLGPEYV